VNAGAPPTVRALVCDVFGTVVDWRSSIAREVARLGLPVDPEAFADAWRAGYLPAMQEVRSGALPWTSVDGLHRRILDRLLAERGIELAAGVAAELNRAWHRLAPWPDSAAGLARLRHRYLVSTLSNGNVALLVALSRHAGLVWDCVLSAELFEHYKPDPEVYLGAARLLDLPPARVMMVAAHADDLRAARACGLATAHVARPAEFGAGRTPPVVDDEFDVHAADFVELALRLGA
jgi:2-haloacid dehalogenase